MNISYKIALLNVTVSHVVISCENPPTDRYTSQPTFLAHINIRTWSSWRKPSWYLSIRMSISRQFSAVDAAPRLSIPLTWYKYKVQLRAIRNNLMPGEAWLIRSRPCYVEHGRSDLYVYESGLRPCKLLVRLEFPEIFIFRLLGACYSKIESRAPREMN